MRLGDKAPGGSDEGSHHAADKAARGVKAAVMKGDKAGRQGSKGTEGSVTGDKAARAARAAVMQGGTGGRETRQQGQRS